ncbi:hypothetical protein V6N13_057131 [Hibiscus sabdariffa]
MMANAPEKWTRRLRSNLDGRSRLKNENLNKAPGPDDFPAAFCQRMWPHTLIKLLILKVRSSNREILRLSHLFRSGKFSDSFDLYRPRYAMLCTRKMKKFLRIGYATESHKFY